MTACRVFKTMHGYGEWLQLSVFQCRLIARRRAELETHLREFVKAGEDHVLLIDVGQLTRRSLLSRALAEPSRVSSAALS
jgi:CRISPR-associated protein Cas2